MIPVNKFKLLSDKTICLNFKKNWISSVGPSKKFEDKFKKLIGKILFLCIKWFSCFGCCTKVIDIKGDEVIIPNFTIISPAISVIEFCSIQLIVILCGI